MFENLLVGPFTKMIAAALAAALLFGGAYIKGRSDGRSLTEAAVEAEKSKWERKVAEAQADTTSKTDQITADYNKKAALYRAEIAKLKKSKNVDTKIVEAYIPPKVNTNVPNGFVDLHDRAATGSSLESAPKPTAAEPSDKYLALVASTVAENYYACNEYIARLEALQEVVKTFQKKQKELTK